MIDEIPPTMPRLGAEGDACSSCHGPLAIDQRYCLQCGQRRGPSRVELSELLPASGAEVIRETTREPVTAASAGPWTPLALVGSIATLGVMLLLGVMIGRDDSPQQITAAAAPVAPAATAATDPAAAAGGEAKAGSAGGSGGGKDAKDAKQVSNGGAAKAKAPEAVPASEAPGAETIDQNALDALEGATGQDAADASKNLPDTIALPGKPPPVDNEEPGGGTDAQVIK